LEVLSKTPIPIPTLVETATPTPEPSELPTSATPMVIDTIKTE